MCSEFHGTGAPGHSVGHRPTLLDQTQERLEWKVHYVWIGKEKQFFV